MHRQGCLTAPIELCAQIVQPHPRRDDLALGETLHTPSGHEAGHKCLRRHVEGRLINGHLHAQALLCCVPGCRPDRYHDILKLSILYYSAVIGAHPPADNSRSTVPAPRLAKAMQMAFSGSVSYFTAPLVDADAIPECSSGCLPSSTMSQLVQTTIRLWLSRVPLDSCLCLRSCRY